MSLILRARKKHKNTIAKSRGTLMALKSISCFFIDYFSVYLLDFYITIQYFNIFFLIANIFSFDVNSCNGRPNRMVFYFGI